MGSIEKFSGLCVRSLIMITILLEERVTYCAGLKVVNPSFREPSTIPHIVELI